MGESPVLDENCAGMMRPVAVQSCQKACIAEHMGRAPGII
jgi:hypothetical protein